MIIQLKLKALIGSTLLVALTGCASWTTAEELPAIPEPSVKTFITVASESDLKYPLLEYTLSPELDLLSRQVRAALADKCELKFGIDDVTPVEFWETEYQFIFPGYNPLQWGAWTNRDPDSGGFETMDNQESSNDKSNAPIPSPLYYAVTRGIFPEDGSLTAADIVADDGTPLPPDGCSKAALREYERVLTQGTAALENPADEQTIIETLEKLWGQSTALTKADNRALEVQKKWSQCMSEEGYSFMTRGEAGDDYGRISEFEWNRKMSTDVDCAIKTNYVGIHATLQMAYQKVLIERNQAQLSTIGETLRLREKALRKYVVETSLW